MIHCTPCECPEPGYCERHRMEKPRQLWLACRNIPRVFQFMESTAKGELKTPPPPAPRPRCQHRGVEILDKVPCELCGNRQALIHVYSCSIHERCTEKQYRNSTEESRMMSACANCSDYAAPPIQTVNETQI